MAYFLRPAVSYPVRCAAPALFSRPAYPSISVQDFAPVFSLFDESLAQLERAQRQSRQQFKRPFTPKFDVKEVEGAYSVEGELPGFNAGDISVEFLDDGHTLQIRGKTVRETKQGEAPKAVEATPAPAQTEQKSDTGSVRSHQATVEDEVEEGEQPANASAVAESSKPAEQQQVTQQPEAQQQQEQDTKHLVSERYTGSFTRSFKFPSKVNQEAVKASLKDGILAITLPFAPKPASRRIQIE